MHDIRRRAQQIASRPVASQVIVQDYLDTLLREAVVEPAVETPMVKTVAESKPAPVAETSARVAVPPPAVKPASVRPASPVQALVKPLEETDSTVRTPTITGAAVSSQDNKPASTLRPVPDWAEKPFASLLFDVAGLKLAAPLHKLGGIMPMEDKLQSVVAQADWFMGLMRWNGRTIRIVDTARFVMPERLEDQPSPQYHSVVVLGDSNWALAVNDADQSVTLTPADIRWRKTMGKRPWLAGTVLNRLCALLDVEVLTGLLDASDAAASLNKHESDDARSSASRRGTDSA